LDRLLSIRTQTDVCLVLHGGSGIPAQDLREAMNRGICKINIATEIKDIFMKSLKNTLLQTDEIDLRKVFPPAITQVKDLIVNKIRLLAI